jgi:type IV pilus assembly protein PilO
MALPAVFDPIVNLPKQYKVIIGVVGLAVIVGAAYYLVLGPAQEKIDQLEASLKTLEGELAQHRQTLAQLELAKKQAAELEQKLAQLTTKLPTEREIPPLYRSVSDAAFQAGLGVSLFQPKDPRVKDFYSEIPITISAEGTYHDLAKFLDRVAALPRVVNVAEWKLTAISKPKVPVRADLTLATYTYRPVGSPPAPKPAEKK